MPIQRRVPPGRTEAAARRPRPAPLSPHPEWRFKHLFLEPRYGMTSDADFDDAVPAPAPPPAFRPRQRPYRP